MLFMEHLVSVIIPVYNRLDYLPECMESLLAQTYRNLEILLIDDGSTDGTLELCRRYAQEDPRIVVIAADHGGVSKARNLGLDAAKGEYVFFVDSDDVPHPRLAEVLLHSLTETGAAIAGTKNLPIGLEDWHEIPRLIQESADSANTVYKTHEEVIHAFFYGLSPFGVMGGIMIRREFIGQTRFHTELSIGEDYYFIYQNLIKGADAVFLTPRWYYYRNHPMNSDRNHSYASFWSRFYRRKLVWQSEEALGRTEYANIQKRNALSVYLKAITVNRMSRSDQKQMRKVIKAHRRELFPALRPIGKLRYYSSVYLPFTQRLLHKLRK